MPKRLIVLAFAMIGVGASARDVSEVKTDRLPNGEVQLTLGPGQFDLKDGRTLLDQAAATACAPKGYQVQSQSDDTSDAGGHGNQTISKINVICSGDPADSIRSTERHVEHFHGLTILSSGSGTATGSGTERPYKLGPYDVPAVVFVSLTARMNHHGKLARVGLQLDAFNGSALLMHSQSDVEPANNGSEVRLSTDDKFFIPKGEAYNLRVALKHLGDETSSTGDDIRYGLTLLVIGTSLP